MQANLFITLKINIRIYVIFGIKIQIFEKEEISSFVLEKWK